MPQIDKSIADVLKALNDEPVVKEFDKARLLVQNDEFIINTEKKLKELQQEMTRNVMDKALHTKLKDQYNKLKREYDNHPYVLNYNSLLNDVNDLLLTLKTIIE